jgi:tetratricopeptide (TPR) repeat protein
MRIASLVVLLGLIAQPALAATLKDVSDCNVTAKPDEQIAPCTSVIEDQSGSDYLRDIARFNRGVAYELKGAYEEALADFDALLHGKPIGLVYANRGLVYQRLGDFERSIADFNEALRLDPTLSQAHKWRGVSYFNIRENERAIADFSAALRLDPKNIEAYLIAAKPMKLRATSRPRSPTTARISIASPSRFAPTSGVR